MVIVFQLNDANMRTFFKFTTWTYEHSHAETCTCLQSKIMFLVCDRTILRVVVKTKYLPSAKRRFWTMFRKCFAKLVTYHDVIFGNCSGRKFSDVGLSVCVKNVSVVKKRQ